MGADAADGGLRPLETPRSLAEDAAALIRAEILGRRFQRGQHLVEATIAKQLGISRGPVREAFKLLRADGLVAEEPRRGTFVVTLNSRDVREIYDLRAAIEGAAAHAVATARDPAVLAELHGIIERMAAAVEQRDFRAVGRADLDFHEAICRLSGNRRIHAVFGQHVPALRTLLQIDEYLYSSAEIASQHRPLLEAIEQGKADVARRLSEEHCRNARDRVAAYIDSQPDD